ncbi:MAG: hypothetical protein R2760_08225 [Chitinophagales bacterium]|jgi:hypothetical protein|nr:hypothetical protein [Bacteroidota bacterium]MCB9074840.1 hypothetical protein [Chitinophagales bacterium]
MKKISLIFLTLLTVLVEAQECPEFNNSIALLKSDNMMADLEEANATLTQKRQGLYGGWNNLIKLSGKTSGIILKSSETIFVFKPLNDNIKPNQQIKLFQFEEEKKSRALETGGTNIFGGSKDKKSQDTSIPLKFEKTENGCYKITIGKELTTGEYAFSLGENASVQGQSSGYGQTSRGQLWYGFTIK